MMDAHLTEPPVKAPRTNTDIAEALGNSPPTTENARAIVGFAHIRLAWIVEHERPKLRAPFAAVTRYLENGIWEKPVEVVGRGPFPLAVAELVAAVDHLDRGDLAKAMELAKQAAIRTQNASWEQAPLD